jgi:hypothetical protein
MTNRFANILKNLPGNIFDGLITNAEKHKSTSGKARD